MYNLSMEMDKEKRKDKTIAIRSGISAGKGLGDQVADFTHFTGIDRLAKKYSECTGNDCGCEARRDWLNQVYPG